MKKDVGKKSSEHYHTLLAKFKETFDKVKSHVGKI